MKKYIVLVAIVGLILGGCQAKEEKNNQEEFQKPREVNKTTESSLRELMALGKAQKCTWQYTEDGQKASGTMYVSGKNFRQNIDMNVQTDNKEVKNLTSSIVSDGESMYIWNSEIGNKGFKIKIPDDTTTVDKNNDKTNVEWDKKYSYQCLDWQVNDAEFMVPKNIVFDDMEEQLNKLKDLQKSFTMPDTPNE